VKEFKLVVRGMHCRSCEMLVNEGLDEVAGSVSMSRQTVHDILWRFVEHGLDAVYDARREGRPHYLSLKQRQDLKKRLIAGSQSNGFREGSWSTRMVLHLVEERYGRKYTREHMTRVLHKLGFSRQKPRPSNALKPSEKEIREFKKKRGGWCLTTSKEATSSSAGMKPHSA